MVMTMRMVVEGVEDVETKAGWVFIHSAYTSRSMSKGEIGNGKWANLRQRSGKRMK